MTIGPEPMTRTDFRSWRFGMSAPALLVLRRTRSGSRGHQLAEPVEQVLGIVRAGRRLRVVLDAERRDVQCRQPFYDIVVETNVADLDPAERGVGDLVEGRVHGEPVGVRGDLDLARGRVLHRLVDAAVAVLELVGAEAERLAEDLVAEADPEDRDPPLQD